ncbi:WD40 repeat-like protein [Trametes elegans]|nr:WD40 repeat-like protein [Trametes elegans]
MPSSISSIANPCHRLWDAPISLSKYSILASRRNAVEALLLNGAPYSKKLSGHTSCVNSLTISPDGRWLASGGDDPNVHLWDFNQEALSIPSWQFRGPKANVFTLAFSASGQYLYSGDTRSDILQYDLAHLVSPVARTGEPSHSPSSSDHQHEDSIRAISCHPQQDEVFLSASEDGRIILHDMRADNQRTPAQGIFQQIAPFSCVQYHPTMTQLFATSDTQGVVCLRDVRMAFGPLSQRRCKGIVQKYVTTISQQGKPNMAKPETSSLVFDREGRRLALTMLHTHPALYAVNDSYPIATFSGRYQPDGTPVPAGDRTWSNSCTMKHGSFGGFSSDRDSYFAVGSDDFRAYLWKIPDEHELLERRRVVEGWEWFGNPLPGEIGYTESHLKPRYVPIELAVPHARLTGHASIVNTALIHPDRPYLLTAGIERFIRLHSPTSVTPSTEPLGETERRVRDVPSSDPNARLLILRAMGIVGDPTDEDEDDTQAIALFDQILRTEGNGDVFDIRPWAPSQDSSTSDSGDSDSDMDTEGGDDDVGW